MGKRYGEFKYGDGTKYGQSGLSTIRWGFIVDWDGDGFFTGENEGSRMIDLKVRRGRTKYVKSNGAGLERYQPGELVAVFDNEDGRYDPYNTSSSLYPDVFPGKLVDARVRVGDGTVRTLMRGKITDIECYRQNGRNVARITVMDGLQFLADQTLTIGIQGKECDSLVQTVILPEAGWPDVAYRGWPIYSGSTTKLIQQWALWEENALEAIHQLEDVELGQFVHQRDGYGRFIPSTYTYASTVTITEADCLRDISIPSPWEVVRNEVTIKAYPRRYSIVNDTVFEVRANSQLIPAGQTTRIECKFSWNNKPTIAQYFFTCLWNVKTAGGVDITADVTVTVQPEADWGYGCYVYITHTGATDGYLQYLYVQAVNVSYVMDEVSVVASDAASQALYGKRSLVIDSPIMADTVYAKECADWLLSKLKTPQPWPVIQIENREELQFSPYLYTTRIKLEIPTRSIDAYYRVGGIEHSWLRENGQGVRTTFWLEPYFTPFTG